MTMDKIKSLPINYENPSVTKPFMLRSTKPLVAKQLHRPIPPCLPLGLRAVIGTVHNRYWNARMLESCSAGCQRTQVPPPQGRLGAPPLNELTRAPHAAARLPA